MELGKSLTSAVISNVSGNVLLTELYKSWFDLTNDRVWEYVLWSHCVVIIHKVNDCVNMFHNVLFYNKNCIEMSGMCGWALNWQHIHLGRLP